MKKIILFLLLIACVGIAYPQVNIDTRIPQGRIVQDIFHGLGVLAYYDSVFNVIYNVNQTHPLPITKIGYSHTFIKDTALVANYYKTITVNSNNVNGFVTVLTSSASDTIYVGFNGDTLSSQRSLIPGALMGGRQYYRNLNSINIKGNSALTAHVEVEY